MVNTALKDISYKSFVQNFEIWKNANRENELYVTPYHLSDKMEGQSSHWWTDPILIKPFQADEFLSICKNLYKNDPISPYTGRIVEADIKICKEWIEDNPDAPQTNVFKEYIKKMESFVGIENSE